METEAHIRDLANTKLRDHFERNRGNDYNDVQVLLLYWQKSDDPGFKIEADALDKLFTEKLRYKVQHWEIPPKNSQLFLDQRISNFLTTLIEPHTLGIIHYGGHGDADENTVIRERRSVWASHGDIDAPGGSTLSWSKIQHKLGDVDADVLLILDCCFAAQNLRDRDRVVPSNVEILAACAMRLGTPSPKTKQSFTKALIREIGLALEAARPVIIKDIYSLLARQDAELAQTPIYHPLRANRTIRLDSLQAEPASFSRSNSSLASLYLQIRFRDPVNDMLNDEILPWLMLNAPRDVSHVQIVDSVDRAKKLQRLVSENLSKHSGHKSSISLAEVHEDSMQEVLLGWTGSKSMEQCQTRIRSISSTHTLRSIITSDFISLSQFCDKNAWESENPFRDNPFLYESMYIGLLTLLKWLFIDKPVRWLKHIFLDKILTAIISLFRRTMSEFGHMRTATSGTKRPTKSMQAKKAATRSSTSTKPLRRNIF